MTNRFGLMKRWLRFCKAGTPPSPPCQGGDKGGYPLPRATISRRAARLLASATALCLVSSLAAAQVLVPGQDADRGVGITVNGTGEVHAKPNLVEIDLRTTGAAELSGDAMVKYRDSKRRMLQAFGALKLDQLKIIEKGMSLTGGVNADQMQQAMMRGMQLPDKAQLQVSRTLRLTLGGVQDTPEEELMETLGRIFDVAKDSGITIAPSPEAASIAARYGRQISGAAPSFVLEGIGELREQAYQKAVADARARAGRLAKLTGVRVGPVLAVHELSVSGDDATPPSQPYYYYAYAESGGQDQPAGRVTSTTFGEIPIRVKLQVRFAIENGAAPPRVGAADQK
jgi:uncharacterized protein YggE